MTFMTKLSASLLALSVTLVAQDTKEENRAHIKAGMVFTSIGQLKGITGKSTAPNYEIGYTYHNAGDLGLDLVPYAGYKIIDGLTDPRIVRDSRPSNPPRPDIVTEYYQVSAWRFGLDMVWAKGTVFGQPVVFRTGPLLHNYLAEGMRSVPKKTLPSKRWHIGWRVGTDIAITSKFFAALELTAGEWRSGEPGEPKLQDINPNNPVYGAFMVGMRF